MMFISFLFHRSIQFVYDKDKFTFDDFMGEAEVDLQPLVAAARAYENWTMHESVDFEKWVSSKDNLSGRWCH